MSFDIFLSYSDQMQAIELHTFLTDLGYTVWIDKIELAAGDLMHHAIAEAIKDSKIFMCCIDTVYAKSQMKQSELCFAYAAQMPIIPIMLENLDLVMLGGVGFCLNRAVRVRLFEYTIRGWSKDINPGKLIVQAIQQCLRPKMLNQTLCAEVYQEAKSLQSSCGSDYILIGDEEDEYETFKAMYRKNLNSNPRVQEISRAPFFFLSPIKNEKIGKRLNNSYSEFISLCNSEECENSMDQYQQSFKSLNIQKKLEDCDDKPKKSIIF